MPIGNEERLISMAITANPHPRCACPLPEYRAREKHRAFTLLELIMVMVIIAIMVAMVAPAIVKFSAGRAVDDFGRRIIAASQFARAQSISEARIYHLNFDQRTSQFWVTADTGGGTFAPVNNEFDEHYSAPKGVRMEVTVGAQPNVSLVLPMNMQQQAIPQPSQLIDGTQGGTPGELMQNLPIAGQTYVEFQPTGRHDPATIVVSDASGHRVQVACDTPTDPFREVTR